MGKLIKLQASPRLPTVPTEAHTSGALFLRSSVAREAASPPAAAIAAVLRPQEEVLVGVRVLELREAPRLRKPGSAHASAKLRPLAPPLLQPSKG